MALFYSIGKGLLVGENFMKNLSGVTDNKDIVTKDLLDGKQNTLVSGTNIKTINNGSLLGSGNISLPSNLADGSATGSVRGVGTTAESSSYTMGAGAFAEGESTVASGNNSHAQNLGTIAQRKSQTTLGEYNIADTTGTAITRGTYAVIVGNGTADDARSNALTVDWSGNVNIPTGATYQVNGAPVAQVQIVRW